MVFHLGKGGQMKNLSKAAIAMIFGASIVCAPTLASAHNALNENDDIGAGFVWQDQYNDPLLMPKQIKATGERVFTF